MKSSLVVFLSCLLVFSYCSKISTNTADADTDNPGDNLVAYIQNLEDAVVAEQNEHQTIAEQQDAECSAEISFRTGEVNDANSSLIASNTHLLQCQGALDQANSDLDNLNAQLQVVQSQLSNLQDTRANENQLFQGHEQEHLDAIQAVNEALDILSQFQNAPSASSFAQLGKHMIKQIKVSIGSKYFKHYAPIIAFLADTPADVTISADDLAKLNSLFNNLLTALQNSLANIRDVEAQAVADFNTQSANFNNQIDTINNAINNFAAYVVTMNQCIAQETTISSDASSKLSRNANILANTQTMCAAFDQEFADATAARKEKLANLALLMTLIQSKVADYNAGAYYSPNS